MKKSLAPNFLITKKRLKRISVALSLFLVLSVSSGSLFLIPLSTFATDWDRSSLSFDGVSGDCEQLTFSICNTGEAAMTETVDYQVWFIESGNPRDGEMAGQGVIPLLDGKACVDIDFVPENGAGIYGFSAMQPAGHPGTGVLWSMNIPLYDCCSEEAPAYLVVKKFVEGGELESADFTMHIGDLAEFDGSEDGTETEVEPGTYQVTETGDLDGYELKYSADCGEEGYVSADAGETKTCILTNKYVTECGDGEQEGIEECDNGDDNGLLCDAPYDGTCSYCSNSCTQIEIGGEYCGDGIMNEEFEECDDGPEGSCSCTPECKTVEDESAIIKAYKVVCDSESDLPDWGLYDDRGPQVITANTASDYVAEHENCRLAADWAFEWAYGSESVKVAGDHYGEAPAGNGWNSFDSDTKGTIAASAIIPLESQPSEIWVREVLENGYIPFTDAGELLEGSDYSAEIYCHNDIHNYDNSEWVEHPVKDNEYYCVAFNAPVEEPKGSLKVCKYQDFDTLVETDDSEPLAAAWSFDLVDSNGATTTLTTPEGENCVYFNDLSYGEYKLSEEQRDGWFRVRPEFAVWDIVIDSEEEEYAHFTNALVPEEETGSLEICKLIDVDGLSSTTNDRSIATSGIWDFVVTYPDESTTTISTSLEDNCTGLSGLPLGTYELFEVQKDGYAVVSPENNYLEVSVGANATSKLEFVNYQIPEEPTSLKVCKYEDEDGLASTTDDRVLTSKEWEFSLEWGEYSTKQTTIDGCTVFSDLAPGEYTITETEKANWFALSPDNGTDSIVLEKGIENSYDFVNYYYEEEPQTYCGDGIKQSPNDKGKGGPDNDGYEECDGKDGVPDKYTCNSSCVLKKESTGGGGGGGRIYLFESDTEEPEVNGEEGEPALTITKTVGQEFANPGDTGIMYKLVIANNGNMAAYNVIVTDKLPLGLVNSETKTMEKVWEIGDLLDKAVYTIDYTVDVLESAEEASYVNTAEARADNHGPVTDTAVLEIRTVEVLAETGFSIPEFILLFFALSAISGTALILQKQLD